MTDECVFSLLTFEANLNPQKIANVLLKVDVF